MGFISTTSTAPLTVDELRSIFALFTLARTAPADLMEQAAQLLAEVEAYQAAYEQFERVWNLADGAVAADFTAWLAADPDLTRDPEDPVLRPIAVAARRLLALKRDQIEPGLRRWMIRSLREDKRRYRQVTRKRLRAGGGAGAPFLLYERFIAELFRSGSPTQ